MSRKEGESVRHDSFVSVERVPALKELWHLLLRGFNKIVNVFSEFAPHPCLEPQEDRCLWILEVIFIAGFICHLGNGFMGKVGIQAQ